MSDFASIPEMVRASCARHAEREAVVDAGTRWTYAELGERVERASDAFAAAGVGRGDRVALWAPNIPEWIVAALGASAAGGVLVPLNTRYKGAEAADILRRSGARVLCTVTGFLDTDYPAMLAGHELPALERTVVLRGEHPGAQPWAAFLDEATPQPRPQLGPGDLSDLIFPSGTTGRPKGVMSTHGQTLRVFGVWSDVVDLRADDRYLIVNPFFHTFGYKAGFLAAILRGATVLPHPVFDAAAVLERIAADRVSFLPGPPTLYQSMLNHPDLARHDLSALRCAVTGAAVIPVDLIRRMRDDLGFETVLTAYGLTEATGVVTMCRPGDDLETIATTCGSAIPDTEVRVVDDDGAPLPAGQAGEVVVRGYNVMRGYLDDPEQTAATVRDGWLHTGDIGVLDDRGYLRITDRKKDMFIVGGFNAYPAEIENDLLAHPDVAQVAVVGIPDERLGEVGAAAVVPAAGASPEPEAIITWARDRIANFKVPRRVVVVDALPTNASGKVLKHELREQMR
jgi:HIP---CoA ligase